MIFLNVFFSTAKTEKKSHLTIVLLLLATEKEILRNIIPRKMLCNIQNYLIFTLRHIPKFIHGIQTAKVITKQNYTVHALI